ncbi:hypothetical protein ACP4OV_003868 [Aristida adscensionis]
MCPHSREAVKGNQLFRALKGLFSRDNSSPELIPDWMKNKDFLKEIVDGIVSINGFFTAIVFLGVTGTVTPLPSIRRHCVAGDDMYRRMFRLQIISFGLYLVSSLTAQALKVGVAYLSAVNPEPKKADAAAAADQSQQLTQFQQPGWPPVAVYPSPPDYGAVKTTAPSTPADPNDKRRLGLLVVGFMVSFLFSALGSFILIASMTAMIQIKLGLFSCGDKDVVSSVIGISFLIPYGLLLYVTTFFRVVR